MNEITGAFLKAFERNENIAYTRQSLANAGYSIQEIEEALMEANQKRSLERTNPPQNITPSKKPKKFLIILLIFLFFLVLTSVVALFFYWDKLLELFKGSV